MFFFRFKEETPFSKPSQCVDRRQRSDAPDNCIAQVYCAIVVMWVRIVKVESLFWHNLGKYRKADK